MTLANNTRIAGLQLGFDYRQVEKPFVVEGKNFLVNLEGPYSAFGNRVLCYDPLTLPKNAQTVEVGSESFVMVNNAVLKWNPTSQLFVPVFTFSSNSEPWPWYGVNIGLKYYFCKKGGSLLEYNPASETWTALTGGDYPDTPVALCNANGRLVVLDEDGFIYWSALDDGSDFTPDVATGAGFQSWKIIGGGEPLSVLALFDGFIVYTKAGLLRGSYTSLVATPFRVQPLTGRTFSPINPHCVIEYELGTHLFLTASGFKITSGKVPEDWEPAPSEFMGSTFLRRFDLSAYSNLKMTFLPRERLMFLSYSESGTEFFYNKAYVHYKASGDWSSFDREHTHIGSFRVLSGVNQGLRTVYIDWEGFIREFFESPQMESEPPLSMYTFAHGDFEFGSYYNGTTLQASSVLKFSSEDPNIYGTRIGLFQLVPTSETLISPPTFETATFTATSTTISLGEDYMLTSDSEDYMLGSEDEDFGAGGLNSAGSGAVFGNSASLWGLSTYVPQFQSIDSYVRVGTWRWLLGREPLELSEINSFSIATNEAAADYNTEDYMDVTSNLSEDYMLTDSDEDYGYGLLTGVDFDVEILSTLDGVNRYSEDYEIPYLETTNGGARYYSTLSVGTYHMLTLSALESGQNFRLKNIELSGQHAGMLF